MGAWPTAPALNGDLGERDDVHADHDRAGHQTAEQLIGHYGFPLGQDASTAAGGTEIP